MILNSQLIIRESRLLILHGSSLMFEPHCCFMCLHWQISALIQQRIQVLIFPFRTSNGIYIQQEIANIKFISSEFGVGFWHLIDTAKIP